MKEYNFNRISSQSYSYAINNRSLQPIKRNSFKDTNSINSRMSRKYERRDSVVPTNSNILKRLSYTNGKMINNY